MGHPVRTNFVASKLWELQIFLTFKYFSHEERKVKVSPTLHFINTDFEFSENVVVEKFYNILQYTLVENGENMISLKYIFHLIFHWKGIYSGLLYLKTCLGISI